ncbi:hypothetical protein MMC13_008466 [Lambiella insularis]|nr:hypothetical protein [Lambiella insularis]
MAISLRQTFSGPLILPGVTEVKGNIFCSGVINLTSITGNDMLAIDQPFELHDLLSLTTFSLQMLQRVQNVSAINVPILSIIETNPNLDITAFQFSGSNLTEYGLWGGQNATKLSVILTNNTRLNFFALPNITTMGSLMVAGNGSNLSFAMEALQTVGDFSIWNASYLYLPALQKMLRDVDHAHNKFTTIESTELVQVQAGLFVDGHADLLLIDFPALQTVNGVVQIAENPQLLNISLQNLTQSQALDFADNFSSYISVQSSNPALKCTTNSHIVVNDDSNRPFPQPQVAVNSPIIYPIISSANPSSSTTNTSSPSPPASTSPSSTPSTPSPSSKLAIGLGIGLGIGVGIPLVLLAAIIFFFRRRRHRPTEAQRPHSDSPALISEEPVSELDSKHYAQLDSAGPVRELTTGRHYVQLDTAERVRELGAGTYKELPELPGRAG